MSWLGLGRLEADLLDLFLELELALPLLDLSDDFFLSFLALPEDLDFLFLAGGDLEDLLRALDLTALRLLRLLRTGEAPRLASLLWDGDLLPPLRPDEDLTLPDCRVSTLLGGDLEARLLETDLCLCLTEDPASRLGRTVDLDVDFLLTGLDVDFLLTGLDVDFLLGDFEVDFLLGDFEVDFLPVGLDVDFLLLGLDGDFLPADTALDPTVDPETLEPDLVLLPKALRGVLICLPTEGDL